MRLGYRCAGISLMYESGVDSTALGDYEEALAASSRQLAADAGQELRRRAAAFVFKNPEDRQRGLVAMGLDSSPVVPDGDQDSPGFAYQGDDWLVASNCRPHTECQERRSRGVRLGQVAHELTHTYLDAALDGAEVPAWFHEGLATYYEDTLPNVIEGGISDVVAAADRKVVLDALAGKGPGPLFKLSDMASDEGWETQGSSDDLLDLEYAQSYYTVKWLIERAGPGELWRLAHAVSAAGLEGALQQIYQLSLAQWESRSREAWSAELSRPAPPAEVRIHVASAGDDTTLWAGTLVAGRTRAYRSEPVRAGDYVLRILPDGTVVDPSGKLPLSPADPGDVSLDSDGAQVYVERAGRRDRPGDDALELDLSYGLWAPLDDREFWPDGAEDPDMLSGSPYNPFPDGNSIRLLELAPGS